MSKIVLDTLQQAQASFSLLNVMPDIHTWLKDEQGLFVFANQLFLQRFGFSTLDALKGKSDYDLAPAYLADKYCLDDDRVLKGEMVSERLELITNLSEAVSWFQTSKWPVYNHAGEIIGTFGLSRHLNKSAEATLAFRELSAPIDFIRQNFSQKITIKQLAEVSNISVSALERRFKKHLSKSPSQYITEVRLDHARALLVDSVKAISSIALETGFSDHSHFTRAFVKRFDISPSKVRKQGQ